MGEEGEILSLKSSSFGQREASHRDGVICVDVRPLGEPRAPALQSRGAQKPSANWGGGGGQRAGPRGRSEETVCPIRALQQVKPMSN